jgi:transcriptional regulator with XRE-family HTH domain
VKRVHRNLSRDEVEKLRERLTALVPIESASIPELLRMMRLIARKSQAEYAHMCGVAPRVLANIEGGVGSPTVETLGKLLRPFGYRVGVVMDADPGRTSDASHPELEPRSTSASTQDSQAVVESALQRALKTPRRRPDQ